MTSSSTAFAICVELATTLDKRSRAAYLLEPVCHHVSHPPALVLEEAAQSTQQHTVARLLLLRHCFGDRNENIDGQESDAILVVGRKMLEKRDHLFDYNCGWHGLDKFGEVVGCLSSDHGRVVMDKLAIVLPQELLRGGRSTRVGNVVEARGGDLGGKPVGLGEAQYQWDKIIFDLRL